ncbi:MAG: HigA family addiction module antitoxin [Gemmatimonadota bacterium]
MRCRSTVAHPLDRPNLLLKPDRLVRAFLKQEESTLSQLVNENRSVSPEMALKLGRFFGNGTELWMNMQTRYDRWEVEHDRRALREAERVEPVLVS